MLLKPRRLSRPRLLVGMTWAKICLIGTRGISKTWLLRAQVVPSVAEVAPIAWPDWRGRLRILIFCFILQVRASRAGHAYGCVTGV